MPAKISPDEAELLEPDVLLVDGVDGEETEKTEDDEEADELETDVNSDEEVATVGVESEDETDFETDGKEGV